MVRRKIEHHLLQAEADLLAGKQGIRRLHRDQTRDRRVGVIHRFGTEAAEVDVEGSIGGRVLGDDQKHPRQGQFDARVLGVAYQHPALQFCSEQIGQWYIDELEHQLQAKLRIGIVGVTGAARRPEGV